MISRARLWSRVFAVLPMCCLASAFVFAVPVAVEPPPLEAGPGLIEGFEKSQIRAGLALASVEGEAFDIETQGAFVIRGEGGAVEVSGFRRQFTSTVWRTVNGKREVVVADQKPVRMGEESKLVMLLNEEGRKGRLRVELTFYPNVQTDPVAGSLICVDGVYFGFRQTGNDSFEFVALNEDVGDRLKWDPLLSASVWKPDTPELAQVVSEGRDLLGVGGLEWGTFQVSFLIDYDANDLRVEQGNLGLGSGIKLTEQGDEPYLVVSSGFGSEVVLMDLIVQDAEAES